MLMTPVLETNKHVHGWWIQRRTSLVDDVSSRTEQSLSGHWCRWYAQSSLCQSRQCRKTMFICLLSSTIEVGFHHPVYIVR